jgi:hypothetical protein
MSTYDSPGCYHDALNALARISGISKTKEIRINDLSGLRRGKRLAYRSYDIQVIGKDGKSYAYMQEGGKRFDQAGIEADHFLVTVNRKMEEFGVKIEPAGQYNDSLGGGWYCKVPRYLIDGQYFADMECTC